MSKPVDILDLLRMSDSFIIRDYSADSKNPNEEPVVAIVPADALFEIIQDAHKNKRRITISPIGPVIIDWR